MNDRYAKLEITMNSIIVAIIIIITAIFFWPNEEDKTQSNKIDETKNQIQIIVKRINIRKDATIYSEDIGDVYDGEIYTVLDTIDKIDYYWYKIETNQGIVGYIASDPNDEYVKVINGYIDRTPPNLNIEKEFLTFQDGVVNYDYVKCTDEYSKCYITHDKTNSQYITFTATDELGNSNIKTVKYYNIYNAKDTYLEENEIIKTTFIRNNLNNKTSINATYKIKKDILNTNKSINYNPIMTFYDENFNEIKNIEITYNEKSLKEPCINNSNFSLKEEYLDKNLSKDSILCINYNFKNDTRIKYFALGFQGIENYNKDDNLLANYYSRYYIY